MGLPLSDSELEHAEVCLKDYRNAEARIVAGLCVELNGRRLSPSDLGEVQRGIERWRLRVQIARMEVRRLGAQRECGPGSEIDEGMNDPQRRRDQGPV
jgi:hypothetical protein